MYLDNSSERRTVTNYSGNVTTFIKLHNKEQNFDVF